MSSGIVMIGLFLGLLLDDRVSTQIVRESFKRNSATILAQRFTFSSWRPYANPNRLVSVGTNKGQVMAIAGKPDQEESYYRSVQNQLIRISDWYYIRVGENAETTLLKFEEDTLVSIVSTPTR